MSDSSCGMAATYVRGPMRNEATGAFIIVWLMVAVGARLCDGRRMAFIELRGSVSLLRHDPGGCGERRVWCGPC